MSFHDNKNDDTVYNFCTVQFNKSNRLYHYLTGNLTVKVGDTVVVPVGEDNEERLARVVYVFQCSRSSSPYPVDKVKTIIRTAKKSEAKKSLLKAFLVGDGIFAILSLVGMATFPAAGIACLFITLLYTVVIVSIIQSINGKKPIVDFFDEGEKTCKKCGYTFQKKLHSCPKCAKESSPSYEEIQQAKLNRSIRKAAFWAAVDELTEPTAPLNRKETDIWTKMESEGEWIDHNSEGHDLENGYCIDCYSDIEDML